MNNDDIVTRLREEWPNSATCFNCLEAADEIELLRKELADWQRTVRALEDELYITKKWRDNFEDALKQEKNKIKIINSERDKWKRLFIQGYESDATSDEAMHAYREMNRGIK